MRLLPPPFGFPPCQPCSAVAATRRRVSLRFGDYNLEFQGYLLTPPPVPPV